ncbi:MAG: WYL domain-containing protein, partial [Actinobacteria bacterium]|nr:WYL domain-containing protein [Actinomycetota bacterium]
MANESASSRLARLLLLVPWLKSNPGITIAEAAQAHHVSTEQMMADLAELYTTEIPGMFSEGMLDIAYWRSDFSVDGDCRIYVRDARKLDRPTRLTSEQVAQLIVAIDAARVTLGEGEPHLASARSKLAALLPHVDAAPERALRSQPRPADDVIAVVTRALESDLRLRIDYMSGGADSVTSRVIEPVGIRSEADRVLVFAWCQFAQDWRTFRADRITEVTASDEPSRRPHDDAPTDFSPE